MNTASPSPALKSLALFFCALVGTHVACGAEDALLKRGKYLVENVAMCGDCHSPRNERGEFIQERWLSGAPIDFTPSHPMPAWGALAPNLRGLPTLTTEQAVRYFSTGEGRPAGPTRPPMPQYRLSTEDAQALVTYLKSLKP